MTHVIYFIFFCSWFAPMAAGQEQTPEDQFAKANRLYQTKKYSEAAALYQQLADRDYVSAGLFYNLGNTYYKLNRYGFAIFYYEKAGRMDPNDEDITFNLELAQLHVKDRIITPPDFFVYEYAKAFIHAFSADVWAVLALIFLYALAAEALIKMFIPEGRFSGVSKRLLPATVALFFCLTVIFVTRIYLDTTRKEAVILVSSADIKNEPDAGSPTVFVLHEGSKVEIRSDKEDWLEIKLTDGKVGWVKHDELGIL